MKTYSKKLICLMMQAIIGMYGVPLDAAQNLDSSFGAGAGWVSLAYGQQVQWNATCVQSNGQIIAAGYVYFPNQQIAIARYNSDGSLDTSFGSNGLVVTNYGSASATTIAQAVGVDSSNNIIVAGYTFDSTSGTSIIIARYTSSGVLDSSFGTGGIATLYIGGGASANALVVTSTNEIIVAGVAVISGNVELMLAKYTTSGALDTTFGSSGVVTGSIENGSILNAVTLDSSNNIVAAGSVLNGSFVNQYLITRYSPTGVVDTSFGSSGFVVGSIGSSSNAQAVAVDGSGNVLIAGVTTGSTNQALLVRCTSTGALDTTFNGTGIVTQLVNSSTNFTGLALQSSNGYILAAGYSNDDIQRSLVSRYTTSGSLDTTYGSAGVASLSLSAGSGLYAIALQPSDGRAIGAGIVTNSVPTVLGALQLGFVGRFNLNNSDFVSITSITGSSINTTIPTISGTSSGTTGYSVAVYINGTLFTTVATSGSGNWNAGVSSVLPAGANTILVQLINPSSAVVVSQEIAFTVVPNFANDAVFAYDTTTQTLGASFANITFNTNAQIGTWSHTAGTSSFTCHQAGTYKVLFEGTATAVANNAILSSSMIATKNGTEIPGSQSASYMRVLETLGSVTIGTGSNQNLFGSFIATFAAGDVLALQGLGSNAQLTSVGSGTTKPSAKLVITRIS